MALSVEQGEVWVCGTGSAVVRYCTVGTFLSPPPLLWLHGLFRASNEARRDG